MRKKWALVLSGGGAKGIAHIGAIKALESFGLKPDLIVGCSMGAIIGGLYCSGMSVEKMTDWIENRFNLREYMELPHMENPDTRLWKILQDQESCRLMRNRNGLDKKDSMLNMFRELTRDRLMEDTSIPLVVNAVDLISSRQIEIDKGSVATAMRASMAIPGVFSPVVFQDMILVDGGILDNMPISIARNRGFETVVAINVAKPLLPEHLTSAMIILSASIWIAGRKLIRHGIDQPSLEINPITSMTDEDFSNIAQIIETGEKTTKEHSDRLVKMLL